MRGATSISNPLVQSAFLFQSTLLVRGATDEYKTERIKIKFQSTLLVRGATTYNKIGLCTILFQSTLLVRGATIYPINYTKICLISIHAPRERSDMTASGEQHLCQPFQSTLLVRGATGYYISNVVIYDISIHAPRERSDFFYNILTIVADISIHAPRERSDLEQQVRRGGDDIFQSTLLVRGATPSAIIISLSSFDFNPRSS